MPEGQNQSRLVSMTGFGRSELEFEQRAYSVEVRSYNSRFLDVKVRCPWPNRELDSQIEACVRQRLKRGRVDVAISEGNATPEGARLLLDQQLAENLRSVLEQLSTTLDCDLGTAARLVPPMRNLVTAGGATSLHSEAIWPLLETALHTALDGLLAMRRREGAATLADLQSNLTQVEQLTGQIRAQTRQEPQRHRQKLMQRIEDWKNAGITVDAERIAQEVAIVAERCDVGEEIARLESHVAQMRAVFTETDPTGRKIEFLLQEFNREFNTVGSKSLSADVSHLVVEAKASLERMREQALNVE